MDKKKRNIIIVSVLFAAIILVVIGILCFDSKKITYILLINDKMDNSGAEEINSGDENVGDNTNYNDDNKVDSDNISTSNNLDSTEDHDEEYVIEYFENMESEVRSSTSFKEKFKEYFTTIVDFIFYDKEIKGCTFKGLSVTTKVKIVSIALKIDSKIEEYAPNYKKTISGTYGDIKERLITLYMNIAVDICKNNEEGCDTVKDIFVDIKSTCKMGWNFIKNLIGTGTSKIKEWYEIYSGK